MVWSDVGSMYAADVSAGAAICPTDAIRWAPDGNYFIGQGRCIKCSACNEIQPEAIRVLGALPLGVGAAD